MRVGSACAWLSMVPLFTASCGSTDRAASNKQMAESSVCLKVCLDSKGAYCETYCPPTPGCELICSTSGLLTFEDKDAAEQAAPTGKEELGLCKWSCPQTTCQAECDKDCLATQTAMGLKEPDAVAICCKKDCPPEPVEPPCEASEVCDKDCIVALEAKGVDEKTASTQCCKIECLPPAPPCADECDQQCINAMQTKLGANAGKEDILAVCCKPTCPGPVAPEPVCDTKCDDVCVNDLASQGLDKETVFAKCCQQVCQDPNAPVKPLPPGCGTQCDEKCMNGLFAMGLDKESVVAKCCQEVCAQPTPPSCSSKCDEKCMNDLFAMGLDKESVTAKCCTCL